MKKTSLLVASQNIDLNSSRPVVPPDLVSGDFRNLIWEHAGDSVLSISIEMPIEYLAECKDIIPCFSAVDAGDYSYQFSIEVAGKERGGLCAASLAVIGNSGSGDCFRDQNVSRDPETVKPEIDLFTVKSSLQEATISLTVCADDIDRFLTSTALLVVSVLSSSGSRSSQLPDDKVEALKVPCFSQMTQNPEIAERICSPTSTSMVLGSYGVKVSPEQMAKKLYSPKYDIYGIWPNAIYGASELNCLGYLMHFSSWEEALWFLKNGIPIIASVSYGEGELRGAAVSKTSGHLLVLRGYDGESVCVNDPAAETEEVVLRSYSAAELGRAWLDKKAVGYIILPKG